jgi:hypothetical protein
VLKTSWSPAKPAGGRRRTGRVILTRTRYDLGVPLLVRISVVLCLSAGVLYPCSCLPPITAGIAGDNADVVFRGTITALRDVQKALPSGERYTRRIAVFRVDRVWKGRIGPTFEMTAPPESEPCIGLEPSYFKVGNDLLVYANGTPKLGYRLPPCSRTALAENAKSDFGELGPGQEPR